jgi:hypothetical protein
MTTPHLRLGRCLAAASLAALAVAVPAASAAGIDPAIYETGVPAGQVEHGTVAFTITGAPTPQNRHTEYWLSADRWQERTTDGNTGELLEGSVHDATGTTTIQYKPIAGRPSVSHFDGDDSVPGAGFPAPFNRKLLETGVVEGTDEHPLKVTLQATGPQTIAGFAGTAYEQLTNGQQGLIPTEGPAMAGSHSILVLQNGTYQPLLRETTLPNGSYGTFDQREVLLSRETVPAAHASVKLTKLSIARTISKWRAKIRAINAASKKHKK